MSEIKGQLLAIILSLMVFGAVSGTVAAVYKTTAGQVTQKSSSITSGIDSALSNNSGNSGN